MMHVLYNNSDYEHIKNFLIKNILVDGLEKVFQENMS